MRDHMVLSLAEKDKEEDDEPVQYDAPEKILLSNKDEDKKIDINKEKNANNSCENKEIALTNAQAKLFIQKQNLEHQLKRINVFNANLNELENQFKKEASVISGDKGKARNIGAVVGAAIGGGIASLPGAVAGMSAGSNLGVIAEEGIDMVRGEKTDIQLKIEIDDIKKKIEELKSIIKTELNPAIVNAKELVNRAKNDLVNCKINRKKE